MAVIPRDDNRVTAVAGITNGTTTTVPITARDYTSAQPQDVVLNNASGNPIVPASTVISGQTKVAVTGTAVQLPDNTLTIGVTIKAHADNTEAITIGPSGITNTEDGTGNSHVLEPGESVEVAVINTNVLYINGTANDFISFLGY